MDSTLLINKRQENNPVLKYVRNVSYEWSRDIRPDFLCGSKCGVLYLTLKWHKLHPAYLETRCNDLNAFDLKILLVLSNVEDPSFLLRDLNILCYRSKWTILVSYSVEEAGEYIENLKLSENRNPMATIQAIQQYKQKRAAGTSRPLSNKEKNRQMFDSAVKFLSSIRAISLSDAKRLLGSFGSIYAISMASQEELVKCPGLGPIKSENVYKFFHSDLVIGDSKIDN